MSSIQFGCQGCGQRLKVPEGSEGKQVRCPECETVNVIPTTDAAPSKYAAPPIRSTQSREENPFAAPSTPSVQQQSQAPFVKGPLEHQPINFGSVLEQAWERFCANWGKCFLFSLLTIGLSLVTFYAAQFVIVLAVLSQSIPVMVATIPLGLAVLFVFGGYVLGLLQRFSLNVVRGYRDPLSGIFTFSFTEIFRLTGFTLLMGCASLTVMLLIQLPVAIGSWINPNGGIAQTIGAILSVVLGLAGGIAVFLLTLRTILATYFISDRDATVFEACKQSATYMHDNLLQAFLIMTVSGVLGTVFGWITCGLGMFLAWPFMQVCLATIYSMATGQYDHSRHRTT